MGELLGLGNSDEFAARLDRSKLTSAFETASAKPEHSGLKSSRQLRAAFWLPDPLHTSRSMARKEKDESYPYENFVLALSEHLREPEVAEQLRAELKARLSQDTVENLVSDPEPADVFQPPMVPGYIRRPAHEERFKALCDAGAKVIVLHGLPGMGKTWLAQEMAMQLHKEHVEAPIFRVSNGQIVAADPYGAFAAAGMALQEPVATSSNEYVAMLVTSDHAPLFTIIDGLDSADELNTLLPRNLPRHVVIATCRDRGKSALEHCHFLRVSEMEPDEAISMVRQRLPSSSDHEIEQLASALGSYPLVIRYACSFIANQPISAAQFCSDLQTELLRIAGNVPTDNSATLLLVLRWLVDEVRKSDELAFELLMAMASPYVRPSIHLFTLARYASTLNKGEAVSQTRFGEAMEVIRRFSFFDVIPHTDYDSLTRIVMHALTRKLLRSITDSDLAEHIASRFGYIALKLSEQELGGDYQIQRVSGNYCHY
jgi:hypothetical protein